MLIGHAANRYGHQLLIVGNTGSNNTKEAVRATENGFAMGMHAALQINPYYGKTSEQGVKRHLTAALDIGPGFIYNVPGRTAQDITPAAIVELAQHANFIGVKECAGNERIALYEQQGIACWSGNDDECFNARHQHHSHGVISVTSNIIPGLMRRLMDNPSEHPLNESLQDLFNWLFSEPNPIAINTALSMTEAIQPIFRLPYVPLEKNQRQLGLQLLEAIEATQRVGKTLKCLDDEDFKIVI